MQLRDLHPRRFFLETWRSIDSERETPPAPGEPWRGAGTVAFIFCLVAVSLTLQEYYGNRRTFMQIVRFIDNPNSSEISPFLFALVGWLKPEGGRLLSFIRVGGYEELWVLGYWALWRVFGFFLMPLLGIALHPKLSLGEMGLNFRGLKGHWWVYLVLLIPVLVSVVIVSFDEHFTSYYPFYDNAHRSVAEFVTWELFYIAQFFSLEFFFRGFMLMPLRRCMGSGAIFAMVLPYVMIHYGKPIPECFGAILAGIVLGTLALRTRSIWLGVFIHVTVALAMDLMAIWQVHWA